MKILPYLLHTRPQSFLVTFFAAFTGYAISPEKPESLLGIVSDLFLLFIVFSVFLWGGTNAYNSGQDGNEGPLTLLPDPPKVPRYLSAFGLLLMALSLIIAALINTRLLIWTSVGVLLSIAYSWKNQFFKRGKEIPGIDMIINAFGFGFCSILFGYFLTEAPLTPQLYLIGIGFSFAYLGGMPTSQIFQLERTRKYEQNYTSILGPKLVLKLGALFFCLHIAFLIWAYTNLSLKDNIAAMLCWLGWGLLVLIAAIHSYWWSQDPFTNSYNRMNRQMILMMTSQVLWTIYAWLIN